MLGLGQHDRLGKAHPGLWIVDVETKSRRRLTFDMLRQALEGTMTTTAMITNLEMATINAMVGDWSASR